MAKVARAAVGLGMLVAIDRVRRRLEAGAQSLDGRVVLITGGARGLGLALARTFAGEGARLMLVSRSADELDRARRDLLSTGARVDVAVCDVRNADQVTAMMRALVRAHGRLDVVVNNAGVIQMMPFELATPEDFRDSLDTHFWGPYHVIRAALPHLVDRHGSIVNISSFGGRIAVPHLAPYCVGKFALTALSEGLNAELAKRGVHVLTVTPGLMRTGSHRNVRVRGRHEAEAIWFGLASATSLTSMDVTRAARQIVAALRRRQARLTPGVQAKIGLIASTLTPALTAAVFRLVDRALPAATGADSSGEARWSRDLDLGRAASLMPTRAAIAMNQPVAADERFSRWR
jgi:NAD(P)-dependent dehydrogenase (short-subunit alcohol dehydrogenase family)